MELVAGKTFENETVELAGKRFQGCAFRRCTLSFTGKPFQMAENVIDHCDWQFNDAAHVTLEMLNLLWSSDGTDGAVVGFLTQITGDKAKAEKMARLRRKN